MASETKVEAKPEAKAQEDVHNTSKFRCQLKLLTEQAPDPSIGDQRLKLIRLLKKKWVNGTVLHYYFFPGDKIQKDMVRKSFQDWKALGIGLSFQEVNDPKLAEIRIAFEDDGSWSYLGQDVLGIPADEPTMNFGWDLRLQPDTSLHEIGHSLGFPHEHQNPFAGIVWDEEKVYASLGGPPNNWPRNVTFSNIIAKLNKNDVEGTEWDPDSIMHYPFEAGLILLPEEYRNGLTPKGGLSPVDIAQVRKFYPPIEDGSKIPLLEPFVAVSPELAPGQQVDYRIEPTVNGYHTIQTLGANDTVLALYEDRGEGNLVLLKTDDDSGTQLNARIRIRLYNTSKYIIRARLYSSFKSGKFGLVLSYE